MIRKLVCAMLLAVPLFLAIELQIVGDRKARRCR